MADPLVIVATQRSGTHSIGRALGMVPGVRCDGEILNAVPGATLASWAAEVRDDKIHAHAVAVVMHGRPGDGDMALLRSLTGRVVLATRRDMQAAALSLLDAKAGGDWMTPVHLERWGRPTPAMVAQETDALLRMRDDMLAAFPGAPALFMEDWIADPMHLVAVAESAGLAVPDPRPVMEAATRNFFGRRRVC